MIRYRCPHCAALIAAHERRVGQSSVCKACVKPHPIPADQSLWLTALGEPLHPPTTPPAPVEPPAPEPAPAPIPTARAEPVPEPVVIAPAPEPTPEPERVPPAGAALDLPAPSVPDLRLPDPPPAPDPCPAAPVEAFRAPDPEPSTELTGAYPAPPVARAERAEVDSPPEPVVTAPAAPAAPAHEPEATPRPQQVPVVLPARNSGRFAAPVPAPEPRADPVQLQTQADIAVALTAALTNRMKPRAAPRRDLRPSTAAWMLLTALGVALAALALFRDPAYQWLVLLIGALQLGIGFWWIAWLVWRRDPTRALWCLVLPVALYYLLQYKYARYRPLRFVLTGSALVVLAGWVGFLNPHVRELVGRTEPPPAQQDPTTMSKLEQLRAHREQRSYEALSKLLEILAKTDPLLSEDAKDRSALTVELKGLCDHPDTGVKVRAMAAYARWDPVGARAVCLAAVRSPTADEREWALRLLPQWKDAESARAVQSLIGRPGTVETNRAKSALEEIGGVPAEQAAIALLNRADDQGTKLTALSVLEKVGGSETAAWLREGYAPRTDDPAVRDRAVAAAEAIQARVRAPAPPSAPSAP